jgi:DnaJ domain
MSAESSSNFNQPKNQSNQNNIPPKESNQKRRSENYNSLNEYFQVLGITDADITDEELKKEYNKLVKKHHPDLTQDPSEKEKRTERMTLINKAYGILKDKEKMEEALQETMIVVPSSAGSKIEDLLKELEKHRKEEEEKAEKQVAATQYNNICRINGEFSDSYSLENFTQLSKEKRRELIQTTIAKKEAELEQEKKQLEKKGHIYTERDKFKVITQKIEFVVNNRLNPKREQNKQIPYLIIKLEGPFKNLRESVDSGQDLNTLLAECQEYNETLQLQLDEYQKELEDLEKKEEEKKELIKSVREKVRTVKLELDLYKHRIMLDENTGKLADLWYYQGKLEPGQKVFRPPLSVADLNTQIEEIEREMNSREIYDANGEKIAENKTKLTNILIIIQNQEEEIDNKITEVKRQLEEKDNPSKLPIEQPDNLEEQKQQLLEIQTSRTQIYTLARKAQDLVFESYRFPTHKVTIDQILRDTDSYFSGTLNPKDTKDIVKKLNSKKNELNNLIKQLEEENSEQEKKRGLSEDEDVFQQIEKNKQEQEKQNLRNEILKLGKEARDLVHSSNLNAEQRREYGNQITQITENLINSSAIELDDKKQKLEKLISEIQQNNYQDIEIEEDYSDDFEPTNTQEQFNNNNNNPLMSETPRNQPNNRSENKAKEKPEIAKLKNDIKGLIDSCTDKILILQAHAAIVNPKNDLKKLKGLKEKLKQKSYLEWIEEDYDDEEPNPQPQPAPQKEKQKKKEKSSVNTREVSEEQKQTEKLEKEAIEESTKLKSNVDLSIKAINLSQEIDDTFKTIYIQNLRLILTNYQNEKKSDQKAKLLEQFESSKLLIIQNHPSIGLNIVKAEINNLSTKIMEKGGLIIDLEEKLKLINRIEGEMQKAAQSNDQTTINDIRVSLQKIYDHLLRRFPDKIETPSGKLKEQYELLTKFINQKSTEKNSKVDQLAELRKYINKDPQFKDSNVNYETKIKLIYMKIRELKLNLVNKLTGPAQPLQLFNNKSEIQIIITEDNVGDLLFQSTEKKKNLVYIGTKAVIGVICLATSVGNVWDASTDKDIKEYQKESAKVEAINNEILQKEYDKSVGDNPSVQQIREANAKTVLFLRGTPEERRELLRKINNTIPNKETTKLSISGDNNAKQLTEEYKKEGRNLKNEQAYAVSSGAVTIEKVKKLVDVEEILDKETQNIPANVPLQPTPQYTNSRKAEWAAGFGGGAALIFYGGSVLTALTKTIEEKKRQLGDKLDKKIIDPARQKIETVLNRNTPADESEETNFATNENRSDNSNEKAPWM